MISCYNCKHGDLDTITEPCKSCLEKGTPPYWRFEPIGQETTKEEPHELTGNNIQITIFDVIQEEPGDGNK